MGKLKHARTGGACSACPISGGHTEAGSRFWLVQLRSKRMKSNSTPAMPPDAQSRFRGPFRILLLVVVFAVIFVFVFPLIFRPGIETPADLQFATPFSVTLRITNLNMTPLTDVEYTCQIAKLALANGSEAGNTKVVTRGTIRKIPGRRAVAARCETGYMADAPIKAAEYRLTLRYRTYPWPQQRTAVYNVAAEMNADGQITRWKVS